MINLEARQILVASAIIFSLIGLLRGVYREVGALTGILIATLIVRLGDEFLVGLPNRVRQQPPLLPQAQEARYLLGIYALLILISYLLSHYLIAEQGAPDSRVMGLAAGLINGYLIAFFILPQLVPSDEGSSVDVSVPAGQLVGFLNDNWIYSVVGIVLIIMLLGLRSAR